MKISVKNLFALTTCCGLLIVGCLAGVNAQKRKPPAAGFLLSTSTSIQIGIWDKQNIVTSRLSNKRA